MRILVVEDEPLLADAVAQGLRHEAYAVDVAYDGAAALERIDVNDYDVVVLDRDLPVVHGDDVCKALAERGGETRVLMLTAAAGIDDRVTGLTLGADDYLPKPFAFRELSARVAALGRRSRAAPGSAWTRTGGRCSGTAGTCRCPARSSRCWPSCCAPTAPRCPRSRCWRRPGTRTRIRSRTPYG